MKSKLLAKLLFTVCLCLATAFIFTACKDKEIYANHSDFESYPEYWNSFNNNTGDIYVPDTDGNNVNDNTSGTSSGVSGTSGSAADTSSDDYTANFEDDEISNDNSSNNGTSNNNNNNGETSSDNGNVSSNSEGTHQAPLIPFKN